MAEKSDDEAAAREEDKIDTVPPPPGGDVYAAPTEVCELPQNLAAVLRQAKADSELADAADLAQLIIKSRARDSAQPPPPRSERTPPVVDFGSLDDDDDADDHANDCAISERPRLDVADLNQSSSVPPKRSSVPAVAEEELPKPLGVFASAPPLAVAAEETDNHDPLLRLIVAIAIFCALACTLTWCIVGTR